MTGRLLPARRWRAAVTGVVCFVTLSTAFGGCPSSPEAPERIVLIVVDTLRRDFLSCYGSDLETVNLCGLTGDVLVFTGVSSSFHQTTMSMGAMFTGRTPSISSGSSSEPLPWTGKTWCGMRRFASADDDACVPEDLPTLATTLDSLGYWTAAVVSNALLFRPSGYDRGFRDWVQVQTNEERSFSKRYFNRSIRERRGDFVNRAAIDWIERRPTDRFFLYVHYMDVHDWDAVGNEGNLSLDRRYGDSVRKVDKFVGELLATLSDHDLTEGTLVVLTSDHGETLGEKHDLPGTHRHLGNPSAEPVLRVPLVISPAPDVDASQLLRTEDVFHLIARIAGEHGERARDLAGDEVFLTEMTYRTYRQGRWKSYWPRGEKARQSPWAGDGFDGRETTSPFLFDLQADPDESRDVAEEHPAIIAAHRKRIDELTGLLRASPVTSGDLTPLDRERLRELGYLE